MPPAITKLVEYKIALHFCSIVLERSPDEAFLALAHEQALFSEWPVPPESEEAAFALKALEQCFRAGPGDATAIYQDHLTLFSGPAPLARPWGSVWLERDGMLFGEETMRVRQIYAQWGLAVEVRGREPEDYLGLEFAFCVHLLRKIAGNHDAAATALTNFLDSHLLRWAEPCLRKAAENATDVFYRSVPLLCLDALYSLRQNLEPKRLAP